MQDIPYGQSLTSLNRGSNPLPRAYCCGRRRELTDTENPVYSAVRGGWEARVRAAVTVLARLIGRRIAREQHDRCDAANDNAPAKDAGET